MDNQFRFGQLDGMEFPSNASIRFAVWRKRPSENNLHFIHFVDLPNLALDDLIFCESPQFSGYVQILDFVRHSDGSITDYTLKDANIDFDTAIKMAKTTRQAMEDFLAKSEDKNMCVIVCLKSKAPKGR